MLKVTTRPPGTAAGMGVGVGHPGCLIAQVIEAAAPRANPRVAPQEPFVWHESGNSSPAPQGQHLRGQLERGRVTLRPLGLVRPSGWALSPGREWPIGGSYCHKAHGRENNTILKK